MPNSYLEPAELVASRWQTRSFEREPSMRGDGLHDLVDGAPVSRHVRGVAVGGEGRDAAIDLGQGPRLTAPEKEVVDIREPLLQALAKSLGGGRERIMVETDTLGSQS